MLALLLLSAVQSQRVDFVYDRERLSGIYIDGACILGTDVRTNGGYLIGSADGSDAQGRSIISVGGTNTRMKSDNLKLVTPPPYTLQFRQAGRNKLTFTASVGPVPQDYETISFPFDFGLKSMDRIAFEGNRYKLFCSETDGDYEGSSLEYSTIKPRCEIRDISQNLIGKVGGASTEAPSTWGEEDGPYATVRFTVTSSSHYEKLVFMNHPGTHNLEFSFGRVKKGETAAISGEITVTPKAGPRQWTFDAATELNHQIGRKEADGWSVNVSDEKEHYMCFGPYATEVGSGPRTATFSIMLDNVSLPSPPIVTIDIVDSATGTVLAKRELVRRDFAKPMEYSEFTLPFFAPPGAKLEFRTQWHGISYAREKSVVISR